MGIGNVTDVRGRWLWSAQRCDHDQLREDGTIVLGEVTVSRWPAPDASTKPQPLPVRIRDNTGERESEIDPRRYIDARWVTVAPRRRCNNCRGEKRPARKRTAHGSVS